MKDKKIQIRLDEKLMEKIEFLKRLNGFKNISDTIRKVIEKEYRRETEQ